MEEENSLTIIFTNLASRLANPREASAATQGLSLINQLQKERMSAERGKKAHSQKQKNAVEMG